MAFNRPWWWPTDDRPPLAQMQRLSQHPTPFPTRHFSPLVPKSTLSYYSPQEEPRPVQTLFTYHAPFFFINRTWSLLINGLGYGGDLCFSTCSPLSTAMRETAASETCSFDKFPDSYSVPRTLLGAKWDVGRSKPAREAWETIAFFLSAPCLLVSFLLLVWRVDVTTEAAAATMPTWGASCGIAENLAWDSAWAGFLHNAYHTREKPTQTFR